MCHVTGWVLRRRRRGVRSGTESSLPTCKVPDNGCFFSVIIQQESVKPKTTRKRIRTRTWRNTITLSLFLVTAVSYKKKESPLLPSTSTCTKYFRSLCLGTPEALPLSPGGRYRTRDRVGPPLFKGGDKRAKERRHTFEEHVGSG